MASTDAKPIPIKAAAYRITFPILDADGDLVAGATGLDSEVSKDGATFTDCTSEATQIATSSGMYYLDLTSSEMDADTVAVIVKSTEGKTTPIVIYPQEAGDIPVNVTYWGGSAIATPDTAGYPKTTLKSGTGTGEVSLSLGLVSLAASQSGVTIGTVNALGIQAKADVNAEVDAALDTAIPGSPTADSVNERIKNLDDNAATVTEVADAWLKRDMSAVSGESARSPINALRMLRNKWSISGTTLTVTKEDDSTAAWTATLTTDSGADPVTASDPA